MPSVYVVGDLHGNATGEMQYLNSTLFPEQKRMTKQDIVIQLGDFGLWWDFVDSKEERYWRKWLSEKPFTFCFVDGNHENFPKLKRDFTDIDFYGGKAKECGGIIWLQRGEIYNIHGKTFYVMGGATSHDKIVRVSGVSWWEEEAPTHAEFEHGLQNLEKHNNKVNYVLTHTCPESVLAPMFGYDDPPYVCSVQRMHDYVYQNVEFDEWHMGHFHVNTWHENLFCHYKKAPYKLEV